MPTTARLTTWLSTEPDGAERLRFGTAQTAAELRAQEDLIQWCQSVEIDPYQVPADAVIHVSADRLRVSTEYFERNERGHRILVPGDGFHAVRAKVGIQLDRPAPAWPSSVLELLGTPVATTIHDKESTD